MKRLLKSISYHALILALVLSVSPALQAADVNKIKFAHMAPPKTFDSPIHSYAVVFKYIMEKRSGGNFEVEIYPSGTLGSEVDVMEALNNNVIQVSMASAAGFHRIFPPAMILFTPYIFRNADIAMEVVNSPYGQKLLDAFTEKTGIKALGVVGAYTYNAITNNKRQIVKPDDAKGLKFRCMDPACTMMFESFGANAVPIAFAELYTSLQTGLVDGQTNPPFIVAWAKLNEVQKYMSLANSQWGYQLLLCNKQWYDNLKPAEKNFLRDAIKAGYYTAAGLSVLLDEQSITDLRKKGMTVDVLGDDQIRAFQEIARPVAIKWARENLGAEWADGLIEAIEAAETKLGYK
jgi:tripartite ATP-independent transporter DctP family solute receptor